MAISQKKKLLLEKSLDREELDGISPECHKWGIFPTYRVFYLNLFSTVLAGARSKFPEFLFTKKSIRKFKS